VEQASGRLQARATSDVEGFCGPAALCHLLEAQKSGRDTSEQPADHACSANNRCRACSSLCWSSSLGGCPFRSSSSHFLFNS